MIYLGEVANLIHNAGVAVKNTNLFVNSIPAEKNGILLRQGFGGSKINHYIPGYRETYFMLIVRGKEYQEALDLINAAVSAVTVGETLTATVRFNYMRPDMEPFPYAFTPGDRIEFVVNIDVCYCVL
jgi:hypothetical protein